MTLLLLACNTPASINISLEDKSSTSPVEIASPNAVSFRAPEAELEVRSGIAPTAVTSLLPAKTIACSELGSMMVLPLALMFGWPKSQQAAG
jgi:hypothetical protein